MTAIAYPHLAARLFNTPLLITPEKAHAIVSALADRLHVGSIDAPPARMAFGAEAADPFDQDAYQVVDGVAVIGVHGTLVAKSDWISATSGLTGYDAVRLSVQAARADTNVRAIVLDVDSLGGEVAGAFDAADAIYAGRDDKPIYAVLSEMACSAAYLLASATSKITVPRTGITGSIGVMTMHADLSAALTKAGINVTLVQYGAQKTDGISSQPLANDARARMQADIDQLGELFVRTVARNRGLTQKQVRGTEAGVYLGAAGVEAGLADAVASPDEAFATIVDAFN